MTTGIKGCNNESNATISFVNTEHAADSQVVSPRSYTEVYAWISQHREKPLKVQTGKGVCSLWDGNWKINAQWDDGSNEFTLANVKKSPQDYRMLVNEAGNISITER
ncbi:hypothetical protein [Nostoc sp.]|uniref:hypothetical protein n=1 Tax=Nostoc sp. TaxID=1180 RepID=UPI002FF9F684